MTDRIDRLCAWITAHWPAVAAVGWGLACYLAGVVVGLMAGRMSP